MQARAEARRRTIIETAVQLFDADGYAHVSLADLLKTTGDSKGAFYYHFADLESVAAAIVEDANAKLWDAAVAVLADSSSPALANLIRSMFVVADLADEDRAVRVGIELRGALDHVSPAPGEFAEHMHLFVTAITTAIAEGDVRAGLDPDALGFTLWAAVLGAHQHCAATGEDLRGRLRQILTGILPGICTPDAARDYLDALRAAAR
jgi:AcrR family transcriptional regulator